MTQLLRALAFALGLSCALPGYAAENIKSAVSGAAESSHVFCDATGASPVHKAPCFFRSLYVTSGATAGYLLVFNAVAAPSNGAVTPQACVAVPANATVSMDFGDTMDQYTTGLTAAYSTTGCFTLTLSATAFFSGRMQ